MRGNGRLAGAASAAEGKPAEQRNQFKPFQPLAAGHAVGGPGHDTLPRRNPQDADIEKAPDDDPEEEDDEKRQYRERVHLDVSFQTNLD